MPAAARRLLPLLALFLLVFGARLWLVQTYGNATPYWDQWDAEAATVLKPWQEGWITPGHFWAPHAEHRIVFTRLETLALLELNGQWDPFVEMVFNAALAALVAVGLAAFLGRALPSTGSHRRTLLVPALVALLFGLPFAWENILAGFQGQFYFLLGFTLLTLAGMGLARPGSAAWWTGAVASVAACFSMGSGFTAAGVVLGWLGLRCWLERRGPTRGEWTTAAVCAAVTVLGLAIRYDPPAHAPLKAENFVAWLGALGRCLAWPRVREPVWGLLTWLPWAGLAAVWLVRQRRQPPAEPGGPAGLVLLGTWLLVQCAAMAYARGANHEPPVSRYFDLLGLGAVVNVLAALWLARLVPAGRTLHRALALGAVAAWVGFLGWGVANTLRIDFGEEMPKKAAWGRAEEANVRAYVATGDRSHLLNKPYLHIPYPDPNRLATLLDDPTLRALLPANIRAPLRFGAPTDPVVPAPAFTANGLPPGGPAATEPAPGRPARGSFLPGANGGPGVSGDFYAPLAPAPTLPYLRWETAGGPGHAGAADDLALAVRDARSGNVAALDPRALPGDRWRVQHVAIPGAPGDPMGILGQDHTASAWLAFREPTEEGRLSYWTGWLARRSGWVLAAGGLCALLGIGWNVQGARVAAGTSKV